MSEEFKTFPPYGQNAEQCVHCKKEIPAGACQQGQLIDHVWYPLHIGCASVWLLEFIPVWTIAYSDGMGSYQTDDPDKVQAEMDGMMENMDDPVEMTITRRRMQRMKFLKLPGAFS